MNVQLFVNGFQVEIKGDEIIAVDYAIASIGNFETRNSYRSANFSVAKTANNRRIFESAEIVQNQTTIPYRRLDCRVFQDGIDMQIRFCDIESIDDNYNLRLYGGNASFFDIIKGKDINELSYLSTLNHEFNLTNVFNSRTNNTGYVYPIIDFHADSPNAIMNNTSNVFDIRYTYPSLFVDDILEQICIDAGYTLVNNIALGDIYQTGKLILPITSAEPNQVTGEAIFTGAEESIFNRASTLFFLRYTLIPFVPLGGLATDSITDTFTSDGALTGEPLDPFTDTIQYYEVPFDGVYTISFNAVGIKEAVGVTSAVIVNINGTVLEEIAKSDNATSVATFDLTATLNAELVAGQKIGCIVISLENFVPSPPVTVNDSSFKIVSEDLQIKLGREVLFQFIKKTIKQSDIIKAYLQMFCGLIQVNELTKTIQIDYFDTLTKNIPIANNWSDKLDYTDVENIEFSLDKYAQINTLTYKEDPSILPQFIFGANGSINIDDETIDSIYEFIKLPFAATEMDTRLVNFIIPKIKIFTTNDESPPLTSPTQNVVVRILLLERVTSPNVIFYYDGSASILGNINLPLAHFMAAGKGYNLGFDNSLKANFYQTLQSVLTRSKIVTENIRLTSVDILELDFMKPVYLDKHNAYFYISKIKNYVLGSRESVEVELVKLR
jgi:hypothetical protein